MGVMITQEFVDVAQAATLRLRKVIGSKNDSHAWDMANWYGKGTLVLHMCPPSKAFYQEHEEAYNEFWSALREADYLHSEPKEDMVEFKNHRKKWTMSAIIKNLEYTGNNDGGEFEP